jgi:hypothetical protein
VKTALSGCKQNVKSYTLSTGSVAIHGFLPPDHEYLLYFDSGAVISYAAMADLISGDGS